MRKMSTVKLEFYNGSGEWNKGALYTMHINKNLLERNIIFIVRMFNDYSNPRLFLIIITNHDFTS